MGFAFLITQWFRPLSVETVGTLRNAREIELDYLRAFSYVA